MIRRLRGKGLLVRVMMSTEHETEWRPDRSIRGAKEHNERRLQGCSGKALSPLTEWLIIKCIHFLCAGD